MTEATAHSITACQVCGGTRLDPVLFLGHVPPVNAMVPVGGRPAEQTCYPLELLRCADCSLVQIGCVVDPRVLFPHSYPYLSGTTRILRDNFADLYREVNGRLGLGADDLIIDIGSNDGTLLANFHKGGHRVLGVEPSQAGDVARAHGIATHTGYFGRELARQLRTEHGPARVVTACNVFAHMGDIHGVVDGILELLAPEGVFISENHYLAGLLETVQYDTIYHEHLRYYALGSVSTLLARHGLEVFHVQRIPTHGGSIRVFSARKGTFPVQPSVTALRAEEAAAGIDDGSALAAFARRTQSSKLELLALLAPLKRAGARIYGIGAPSRASTLITYTGLDESIVSCVLEVAGSNKLDKYMPGTRIPVVEESKLFADQPEYALLLSWHIAEEIAANLRRKGYKGRFIAPLPEPRILAG
jgi:hypothetical protein